MSIVELAFDPFKQVIEAYEALYSKPCIVQFVPFGPTDSGHAFTIFSDDPGELPIINISVDCPVSVAIEMMAHELAHVEADAGCEDAHGPEWQKAFEAIHAKYTEMVTTNVPEGMEVSPA